MKVLIVEDEPPAAKHLVRLLHRYDPAIQVLATTASVEETVQWLRSNPLPDLLFLDIHLADTLSFKIFEQVKAEAPVIFTTAYDQYALRAFKVNSIDYLLKPIDLDDLKKAFGKLKMLSSSSPAPAISAEQIRAAWQMLSRPFKSRFMVRVGDHLKTIPVEDISCFFSRHKMTYLMTTEGRSYPTEYNLTEIEGLVDPMAFFRVSRQYVIRATAIEDVIAFSNSRLKVELANIKTGEDIIVSRERVSDFKEWLDR